MQLKAFAMQKQRASPNSSIMIVIKNIIHLNLKKGKEKYFLLDNSYGSLLWLCFSDFFFFCEFE